MKYMQSICFDIPLLLCVKGKKKSYLRHTLSHTCTHPVLLSPPLPTLPLQNSGDTHPSDKDDHSNKKSRYQRKKGKKHGDKRQRKECEHRKKKQRQRRTKLYEGHQAGLASRVRSDSGARWPRLINVAPQMKGSALAIIPCHNAITQQSDSKIEGSQPPGMIKVLTDLIE